MSTVTIRAHGALGRELGITDGLTTVVANGDITVDAALKSAGIDTQSLHAQGRFLIVYNGKLLSATGQTRATVIASDGMIELLPAAAGG